MTAGSTVSLDKKVFPAAPLHQLGLGIRLGKVKGNIDGAIVWMFGAMQTLDLSVSTSSDQA